MIISIHQPDFLPWLGFFDRWQKSDLLVLLDDVQFLRRGWHHRDKIKTANGVRWLTIPVKKRGRFSQKINEVEIDYTSNWQTTFLKTVEHAYAKAPNFRTIFDELQKIIIKSHKLLIDLNLELLNFCGMLLLITTPITFSSSLKINTHKSQRLIDIILKLNGTEYLTGTGSKGYLDRNSFTKADINIIWQDYNHPRYTQLHGDFIEKLSVIDLLMMGGDPQILQKN